MTTYQYGNGTGPIASVTQPKGNVVAYSYDTRGRVATTSRGSSGNDLRERMAYTYDAATQQKSLEQYLANVSGSWVEKRRESYSYDAFGRLATITHGDGTAVHYSYDRADDLASVQDERHISPNTLYAYDPARRLTAVLQTLSGTQISTRYGYDSQDNLTAVTDPNGNTTSYLFDDFARLVAQDSVVTGHTSYAYDPAANLTSVTDANSATTTRTYDAANRILTATATRANTTPETITWTYDDTTVGDYGLGRLATMSDPTGSTAFTYERRGLLAAESKNIAGASYTSRYRYDTNGNRSHITYPSGRGVDYTFDFTDRALSASSGAMTLVSSAAYAPFGPLTQLAFGNGTTRLMQYDARYRPTENKLVNATGAIADYVYESDVAGNMTQIHDAIDPTFNRDFGYDDLNRLVTANSGTALWGTAHIRMTRWATFSRWRSARRTMQRSPTMARRRNSAALRKTESRAPSAMTPPETRQAWAQRGISILQETLSPQPAS